MSDERFEDPASAPGPACDPLPAEDALAAAGALAELSAALMSDPHELLRLQVRNCEDWSALWSNALERACGRRPEPLLEPAPGDARFSAPAWREAPLLDHLKQAYLLSVRQLEEAADQATLSEATRQRITGLGQQMLDALALGQAAPDQAPPRS